MIPSDWISNGPLLADGAWGTELQRQGLTAGACADEWNLSRPEAVGAVARSYREAGSRVVLTNTFRANCVSLADFGLADRAEAINSAGVAISKQYAPGALVFASIGPTGKLLVAEQVTREEMAAAFAGQATALARAGADALLIETMSDPEEASIAVREAKQTGLPVIVSFAFESGKKRDRTLMGSTPERCAAAAVEAGADAVGANCGIGIEQAVPLCRRLAETSGLPVWIKPNAGLPVTVEGGGISWPASPAEFAAQAPAVIEAGAKFIGGCCGTNPEFIRALHAVLR